MKRTVATLAVMLFVTTPAAARGQVGFGVAGGPSFPTGSLADVVDPGFHGGVVADIGLPLLPFALRADAMFQRLPGANGGNAFQQVSGTLNAQLDLLPIPFVSTYVTAGPGLYGSNFARDAGTNWAVHTGFNVGVGAQVNLLVLRPFVEARFHRVLSDPGRSYVPITLGIFF